MANVKKIQLPNGDIYNLGGSASAGSSGRIKKIQLPNGSSYDVGSELTSLTITENGTYTPESPYDGFSSVIVNIPSAQNPLLVQSDLQLPYGTISGTDLSLASSKATITNTDMAINDPASVVYDEDLIPSNIRMGVNIFGVVGEYEVPLNPLNVTSLGTFSPPSGQGYGAVTVQDANCIAANIREGVTVLGVTGNLHEGITPSGNLDITDMDSHDVTNYASVRVVDSDIVASNIREGVNILGVTGNLHEGITPSGNLDITDMDSHDVTNYASVRVVDADCVASNIKKGVNILGVTGSYEVVTKNIQVAASVGRVTATSMTSTGVSITVAKTGNYKCTWMAFAYGTTNYQTRLYKGNTAIGTAKTCVKYNNSTVTSMICTEYNVSLNAEDVLTIRAKTGSTSYYTVAGHLTIEEI